MKKTPLLLAGVLGLSLCLPAGAASFAEKRINTALNKGPPPVLEVPGGQRNPLPERLGPAEKRTALPLGR